MQGISCFEKFPIPAQVREGLDNFRARLLEDLGDHLVSLILFGGLVKGEYTAAYSDVNLMIVLKEASVETLDMISPYARMVMREIRLSPMVLTEDDLKRSTDVFPIKFLDMKENHEVIWGKKVLDALEISKEHIRLRCEQEIRNLLLRMRQSYLQRAHRDELIERALVEAASPFILDLGIILMLKTGHSPTAKNAICDAASFELGLNNKTLQTVLEIKYGSHKPDNAELKRLYNEFMSTVQKAAEIADKL
jgi:predicted nucleotidyltransferase